MANVLFPGVYTPQEIEEIIIHTVSYAGFPMAINAIRLKQEENQVRSEPN
jgi:alkylhydroperoxidase/carboxymuconolactone decarboxylase family protein YurZ